MRLVLPAVYRKLFIKGFSPCCAKCFISIQTFGEPTVSLYALSLCSSSHYSAVSDISCSITINVEMQKLLDFFHPSCSLLPLCAFFHYSPWECHSPPPLFCTARQLSLLKTCYWKMHLPSIHATPSSNLSSTFTFIFASYLRCYPEYIICLCNMGGAA